MGHAALLVAPLASRTLDWLRAGAAVQKADKVVLPSSEWLPGQRDPGGPFTPTVTGNGITPPPLPGGWLMPLFLYLQCQCLENDAWLGNVLLFRFLRQDLMM